MFTPEESLAYVDRRVGDYDDPTVPGVLDDAVALAEDLPMALTQAVAVVLDQGLTTTALV